MTTRKTILSMGIILLIAGIAAALISFWPSVALQYIFVIASLAVGALGITIGRTRKGDFLRSTYYTWTGSVLIALAFTLVMWAPSLVAFINVVGFFLLLLGFIEFAFALQILHYESPIPWKIVGLKLALSAVTATGAAWILTMAGYDGYMALLFLGLLFVIIGFSFIQISRFTRNSRGLDSDQVPS